MTSTPVSADAVAQAQSQFKTRLAAVTAQIHKRPLNSALDEWLNANLGADTPTYRELKQSCEEGVAQGWLCKYEGGGLRYGRIFKSSEDLHGFSIDVVDMQNVAGPHHVHPQGEIDLIMPIDGEATFDGRPAGWLVCPPGSAHRPTVSQGRALVLYLLPKGEIEFTK
ncbi:DUF4863 family protein [Limnohabitans sp.]|uniref:4-hydroxylaminobenzoate lyase n=1 Tax=Limnohabitans sp. TaxID=1907725 RepID=UPI00286F5D34|nr:DUF4863 family protein [Limnohabitans sp.]